MTGTAKPHSFGLIDLALLALVIIWGANFAIIKSTLSEITGQTFNALRFGGAALLTLTLTWIVERDLRIPRQDWEIVLLLGLIGTPVYQILFIYGIARTSASNASLILATTPIFVALFGTLTRSEKISRRNWIGVLLSFAGLFLLIGGSSSGLVIGSQTLTGDLLVLVAAVIWAIYTILLKRPTQRNSALKITAWVMVSSIPLLITVALPDLRSQDWHAISPQSWLGLLYSAALAIAIGYVIWNTGVQRIGSARTSVYSYLVPLVAVLVAWAFLGESMQPLQALGAVGILLGVALGRYRSEGSDG
jgi:drug/metabolite transporter (DMT)-like permease